MVKTVYINGRFLSQNITGVQRYAIQLLNTIDFMLESGGLSKNQFKFIVLTPNNFNELVRFKNIAIIKSSFSGHIWEQFVLPIVSGSHLLLNFCNLAPILKCNKIVVVHDASVYRVPKGYSFFFRLYYKIMLPILGLTSKIVITDSEFSKKELIRFCKYRPDRVKVILSGANNFSGKEMNRSILTRHNLTQERYIFSLGSMNPNKNFSTLLEAIKLLNLNDIKFVITGGLNSKIFKSHDIKSIPESVIFTGYVSDEELQSLYTNALCFVFPSIYEGFGFPPLEAMSVGCPVITSNAASLPEVCLDAALYCDPYSFVDIANKIQLMIENPQLRLSYIEKGHARVKSLDWKHTVAQMISVF